jgi:ferredoxin--NADP+ reductase
MSKKRGASSASQPPEVAEAERLSTLRGTRPALRIAVVGAGPSRIFTVQELLREGGHAVYVFDRLPVPFGLLRYGVAPDHVKMRLMTETLHGVLADNRVRFFGTVDVGRDVAVSVLRERYHAVVYAVGATSSRLLGIPGERMKGSHTSQEVVAWCNGHPDRSMDLTAITAETAVIIGGGNVALDIARILVRDVQDLRSTDVPDAVLDVLANSSIRDIHVVVRRSPADAKFTTKELRELGELADVQVVVHSDDLREVADPERLGAAPLATRRNLELMSQWSVARPQSQARRVHFHFGLAPTAVLGEGAVERVQFRRLRDGSTLRGAAGGAGGPGPGTDGVELAARLVVSAIGYLSVGIPGVPLDTASGAVPHHEGRVLREGAPAVGEYVVGWLARGPSGVVGTSKVDARQVAAHIRDDSAALVGRPVGSVDPQTAVQPSGRPRRDVVSVGAHRRSRTQPGQAARRAEDQARVMSLRVV